MSQIELLGTLSTAQRAILKRTLYERSFYHFVIAGWHAVEAAPFVDNWHIRMICDHLQAVHTNQVRRLLINVPPGSSKPVHVDELVLTDAGYVRLGDIQVGDRVLTHLGRFRTVLNVYEQGILDTVFVKTFSGRVIRANPCHPFLTTRGWVAASELKPGDYLGVPHRREPFAATSSPISPEVAKFIGMPGLLGRKVEKAKHAHKDRFDPMFYEDEVMSIEPAEPGECRCLTVAEDASFTVHGVAVHNSLLTSVFWPAWRWANDPTLRFLCASYSHGLAVRDAVRCRNLLTSHWYRSYWGPQVQLSDDQNQKTYYETSAGGSRLATTPHGRATAEHPHTIIVDDIQNVEQAHSQTERKAVTDWWDQTISTRGAALGVSHVIIMQRLHTDDLAGHVLAKGSWVHVRLPMRWEEVSPISPVIDRATGQPWHDPRDDPEFRSQCRGFLWLDLFSEQIVCDLERALGQYGSASQLQQRPSPLGGGAFKRADFRLLDPEFAPTEFDAVVRFWDRAGTEGAGDWTVGVLMAKKGDAVYVLDIARAQLTPAKAEDLVAQTAALDDRKFGLLVEIWEEQEPGSGGVSQAQSTLQRLKGYRVNTEPAKHSKTFRAQPWAVAVERREVFLINADWTDEFLHEHENFPAGKYDDQVDAASGAYQRLIRPTIVHVAPDNVQACVSLPGQPTNISPYQAAPYQAKVCAVIMGHERAYASYVILGCDGHLRRHVLLDAHKWNPEDYPKARIPLEQITGRLVQKCQDLKVTGVAYNPASAAAVGAKLQASGIPIYESPINTANSRRAATVLMSVFANRRVDLYDDKELAGEIVRLPLKSSAAGYLVDPSAHNCPTLDLGLAFAVALMWAEGTMANEL